MHYINYITGLTVGITVGLTTFIIGTIQTKNIYYRRNSNNVQVFTLNGLIELIKAPFCFGTEKFKTVWVLYDISLIQKLKLWQLNWIITTITGISITSIICLLLSFL